MAPDAVLLGQGETRMRSGYNIWHLVVRTQIRRSTAYLTTRSIFVCLPRVRLDQPSRAPVALQRPHAQPRRHGKRKPMQAHPSFRSQPDRHASGLPSLRSTSQDATLCHRSLGSTSVQATSSHRSLGSTSARAKSNHGSLESTSARNHVERPFTQFDTRVSQIESSFARIDIRANHIKPTVTRKRKPIEPHCAIVRPK